MDNPKDVPYVVFEGTMARFERTIRRLIIAVIVAVVLLFASNALWLYEWTQYDYADVDVNSDNGGYANYLEAGANGAITNGQGTGAKENKEK